MYSSPEGSGGVLLPPFRFGAFGSEVRRACAGTVRLIEQRPGRVVASPMALECAHRSLISFGCSTVVMGRVVPA